MNTAVQTNPDIKLPDGKAQEVVVAQVADSNPPPAPSVQPATILSIIDAALRDPAFDKQKFEALMAWRDRERELELLGAFNNALHKAQSDVGRITADADNPQTRSKYATYAGLDKAIRPAYLSAGLNISYDTAESPREHHIRTLAYVSFGAFTKEYHIDMPVTTTGIQGNAMMTLTHATASAHSYGKRYLLCDIFNLAIDRNDDDGNAAGGGLLSDAQIEKLQKLIVETGSDIGKFCHYVAKVKNIDQIPANRFQTALKALQAKLPKGDKK